MPAQADLNKIYQSLGNIEGTLVAIQDTLTNGRARMDGHDRQIATINQKMNWGTGVVSAVGIMLGWFGKSHMGGSGL